MKKDFLKRTMATGLVAAMALSTAACGSSTSEETNTDAAATTPETPATEAAVATEAAATDDGSYENCTLTMSWWGGDTRHEATLKAIEAFEAAYPGITVEPTYAAWDGWEAKMATAFAAGTAPDQLELDYTV